MTFERRLSATSRESVEQRLLLAGRDVSASPELRERLVRRLGLGEPNTAVRFVRLPKRSRGVVVAGLVISTLAAAAPVAYWSLTQGTYAPTAPGVRETTHDSAQATSESIASRDPMLAPSGIPTSTQTFERESLETTKVDGSALRRPTTATVSPSVVSNRLAEELASLDAVRQRMRSGDVGGALAALDGYQRDFPKPQLALEAEVLRIFALDQSGQRDMAKRRAEAFVAKHPRGVLSTRVRRYIEGQ